MGHQRYIGKHIPASCIFPLIVQSIKISIHPSYITLFQYTLFLPFLPSRLPSLGKRYFKQQLSSSISLYISWLVHLFLSFLFPSPSPFFSTFGEREKRKKKLPHERIELKTFTLSVCRKNPHEYRFSELQISIDL